MSVTFSIEANATGAFKFGCWDEELGKDVEVARADSYEAILVERSLHLLVCEECAAYGCYTQAVMDVSDEFDVNVSQTNAMTLLGALGLSGHDDGDLSGTVDGEQFLGAVLLAMASDRDDSGVRSAVVGGRELGQSGATMIDCGIPEGYFANRFGALHALATEAVRMGRSVVFA